MRISQISIRRPVSILMLMLIVILLGVVSLSRLSVDLYPDFDIPVAVIAVTYEGAGPEEMETLITRPIEEVLGALSGVDTISSITREGNAFIIIEFDFSTSVDDAVVEVRDRIDMISTFLPADASDPMIIKIDPNVFPIMLLSISSEGGLEEAQAIVEDKVISRLERINGIASVSAIGGITEEVKVTLDPLKLNRYNVSLDYIAGVLRSENLDQPGGQIRYGSKEMTVRTLGQFGSVEEIALLPIQTPIGTTVRLRDLGEVRRSQMESQSYNRLNGDESLLLMLSKQSDYNTVQVADEVNRELKKLEIEIEKITFEHIFDQSVFIKKSIQNVARSGMLGGLFAVLVLYAFLRHMRTTLIIAVSIPFSIIATFILMFFSGVSLNIMTLGGLALGIGMLVDNSIVVLENIYRFRTEGKSSLEAARLGSSEVGMAVTASTLTSVAVFLPIVFVEGVTSLIFRELALTVTFSLLASLLVALTVVPMLASKMVHVKEFKHDESGAYGGKFFITIEHVYLKILKGAIHHKAITFLVAVLVFTLSMTLGGRLGAVFLPTMDEGRVSISVSMPTSTALDETDAMMREIEALIIDLPEINAVSVQVGAGQFFLDSQGRTDVGSIDLVLKPLEERMRSAEEVADEVRQRLKAVAGAEISLSAVESQGFGGQIAPIAIKIQGDELDVLKNLSSEVLEVVQKVSGTREVTTDYEAGLPELRITVDRELASKYGLTAARVGQSVRNAIQGITATQYKVEGRELNVRIQSLESYQEQLPLIKSLPIPTQFGDDVPLSSIGNIELTRGPVQINRENQVRTIIVSSDIFGRDLRSVVQDIEAGLQPVYFPDGYSYVIGGENEELVESFKSLFQAIVLAIILVYMVMASQFESLVYPLLIMFAVPLAIAGGVLALFITGNPISVPALIGGIVLSGIVVNNGIVLIDYINKLRKEGREAVDAVLHAGPIRLRPILMTTLTTSLALAPLAFGLGEGSEASAPMASVVIGGLLLSTLLTLVFLPVLYLIVDRFRISKKEE